jgi:TPR repeat protein
VAKNSHLAAEDFMLAANAGFIPAEAQLGLCYANGVGVKKGLNQAIRWLSLAVPKTPDAAALLAKLAPHRGHRRTAESYRRYS